MSGINPASIQIAEMIITVFPGIMQGNFLKIRMRHIIQRMQCVEIAPFLLMVASGKYGTLQLAVECFKRSFSGYLRYTRIVVRCVVSQVIGM